MRLKRIGEGSALIARIEAINVAAFPEIERISIKNFLKMSRKGQLEIAAIFEDFTALGAGGATDKHYAAAQKYLPNGSCGVLTLGYRSSTMSMSSSATPAAVSPSTTSPRRLRLPLRSSS